MFIKIGMFLFKNQADETIPAVILKMPTKPAAICN